MLQGAKDTQENTLKSLTAPKATQWNAGGFAVPKTVSQVYKN